MEIQKCESCGTKFNYMDLQKSLWSFTGYRTVKCRNCGAKYRFKLGYVLLFSFLISMPILFDTPFTYFLIDLKISFLNRFSTLFTIAAVTYILYIIVTRSLYPFLFRYLKKYED